MKTLYISYFDVDIWILKATIYNKAHTLLLWLPRNNRPELGIQILVHITPQESRYEKEDDTIFEPFEKIPHYKP